MKLADLRKLIARGEDSRLQFKKDVNNADSLAAEMVAFANSEGGRILIGVGNDGKIIGLSRSDVERVNQLISNAASQHVRSPISPLTENVAVGKGRIVIVATIAKGDRQALFRQERRDLAQKRRGQAAGELQGRAAPPVPDDRSVPCRRTAHQGGHRCAGQTAVSRLSARCLQAGVSG